MMSARLIKFESAFDPKSYSIYEIEDGKNLGDFLVETFPNGFGQPFKIYDGSPEPESILEIEEVAGRSVKSGDLYLAVLFPGDSGILTLIAVAVASVAIALALAVDIPKASDTDEDSNRNNEAKGQTNEIRVNERIPDVVGEYRIYPDLILPSYDYYELGPDRIDGKVDTVQTLVEYFCFGVGDYEAPVASRIKLGDSPLNLFNASYKEFNTLTTYPTTTTMYGEFPAYIYPGAILHIQGDVEESNYGKYVMVVSIAEDTPNPGERELTVRGDSLAVDLSGTGNNGFRLIRKSASTNLSNFNYLIEDIPLIWVDVSGAKVFAYPTPTYYIEQGIPQLFDITEPKVIVALFVHDVNGDIDYTSEATGVWEMRHYGYSAGGELQVRFYGVEDGLHKTFATVTTGNVTIGVLDTDVYRYANYDGSAQLTVYTPSSREPQDLLLVRQSEGFTAQELVASPALTSRSYYLTVIPEGSTGTIALATGYTPPTVNKVIQFKDAVADNLDNIVYVQTAIYETPGGIPPNTTPSRFTYQGSYLTAWTGAKTVKFYEYASSTAVNPASSSDWAGQHLIIGTFNFGLGFDGLTPEGDTFLITSAVTPTGYKDFFETKYAVGDVIRLHSDGGTTFSGVYRIVEITNAVDHPSTTGAKVEYLGGGFPSWANVSHTTNITELGGQTAIGPVATPIKSNDVWIDITFSAGLYWNRKGTYRDRSIDIEFTISEADVDGNLVYPLNEFYFVKTFTGNSTIPLRFTVKASAEVGTDPNTPASPEQTFSDWLGANPLYLAVTVARITPTQDNDSDNNYVDQAKIVQVSGVRNYADLFGVQGIDHGNITTAKLVTKTGVATQASSSRSFNLEVKRILDVYDAAGNVTSTQHTRSFYDIFMYRALDPHGIGLSVEDIDTASIKAIYDELFLIDAGYASHFSYSFSTRMSSDEELSMIANVARASLYRIGQQITMTRDSGTQTAVSLFNRRNKSPDAETIVYEMTQEKPIDSVEARFKLRNAENRFVDYTFVLGVDALGAIVLNPPAAYNRLRLELDGIINWSQAYRRAYYELQRARYRVDKLTMEVTEDARILGLNEVIVNTENLGFQPLDGEVIAWNSGSKTLTTDVNIPVFDPTNYRILLRAATGDSVEEKQFTLGVNTNEIVLASLPTFAVTTSDGTSIGTLFTIYSSVPNERTEWIIEEISPGESYVTLKLANFDSRVYDGDTVELPAEPEGL